MSPELLQQFLKCWNASDAAPDVFSFLQEHNISDPAGQIPILLADQRHRWQTESPLKVEDYLARLPDISSEPDFVLQLAVGEFQARQNDDTSPDINEFTRRFPDISDTLRSKLTEVASGDIRDDPPMSFTTTQTCLSGSTLGDQRIGRYRLVRVLGEGAFGRVYLGLDEEIQRQVAIKVPTPERFQKPEDAEAYLAEARTVGSLDHPNIVPVYDVGRTDDGSIYVVSKFIEGCTLGERIKSDRPKHPEAAALLATVATAVHHAHDRRLVHRDVKPANILIEENTGTPYVADFGLAIREEDYLKGGKIAGTPAYMSPEQARGEGHRLDGRSDIFSVGVVIYELLTGKRPFRGSTANEILHQVVSVDPPRPRELDDSIPVELERICLKALSKRASDRYSTAAELAHDLTHWDQTPEQPRREVQVVPKGLRSFEAEDADFFLDLLPGPRNREGLPESIQFWKTRLEETDPDKTFNVGLIYGPSGCGKSSLVKAGLLPRLSADVVAVYVEATPDETETRILRGLRKRLPELPDDVGLAETFTRLRRGEGPKVLVVVDQFEQWLHAHRAEKESELVNALRQCDGGTLQAVVMVRDDFAMAASRFMRDLEARILEGHNFATVDLFDVDHAEKVLVKFGQAYGKLPSEAGKFSDDEQRFVSAAAAGLAEDGKVVSVRLALFADMVKRQPWIPATLREVGGTEGIGVNFLEETFSSRDANPDHRLHQQAARQVLKALLPDVGSDIKGCMQTHADLLEASGYANRPGDFNDLLRILDGELRLITPTDPEGFQTESGSDPSTKHYQLTHDYLVPSLCEWLTRKQRETCKGRAELKLEERTATWQAKQEIKQLPSLAEWVSIRTWTDKNRWTDAQRALMSRASRFHGLRSAVALLGLLALISVGALVRSQIAAQQEATRIEGLVGSLVNAEPNQIPDIVKQLDANPEVAATFLSPLVSASATTVDDRRAQLHARLATVSRDPSLVEPLVEELLTGKVTYVLPIRQQLRPSAAQLTERFWGLLRDERADAQRRFRAALALADYVGESEVESWKEQDLKFVGEQLVSSNAEFQPLLRDALRPIRPRLLGNLERIFADGQATDAQMLSAANAFADYAADDIARLSQLLAVATPEQYAVLYPIVAASPSPAVVDDLGKIAATLPPEELGSVERVPYGQRRANAAVTLLRLGEREKVLPVFDMTDDPEALTQFIFRCRPRGVSVEALLDCLQLVSDPPNDRYPGNTRYALLLGLGEFLLEEIPESRRESLLVRLADWYRDDPSSGVHGAAGWLLRQWGQVDVVRQVDQTPVAYSPDREWFTLAITVTPTPPPKPEEEPAEEEASSASESNAKPSEGDGASGEGSSETTDESGTAKPEEPASSPEPLPPKTFYYTFIVFPPGEYTIGSVEDEPERSTQEGREQRHGVNLTRSFALLDREITFEELIAFKPMYASYMQQYDAKPADGGFGAHWYDSVGFCRWLGQQSGLSEADQAYAATETLDKEAYPREPTPSANWAPRNWPAELGNPGFRLPTESEWEVASRAGARTAYGYGSDVSLLGRFGWFTENSGKHVHPPRELRPSVRGLFDLHGNLYEWTHDWYGVFGPEALRDPAGEKSGSYRVNRGGSWSFVAASCRTAYRSAYVPARRANNGGLRLALSPSSEPPEAEEEK